MRKVLIVAFLIFCGQLFSQIRVCSWNLCDMGKSKSQATIDLIAKNLRDFDVVALQEIVAGNGGAQAVAKLVETLNRSGAKWDYVVSDPTEGTRQKKERYAFLWKPAKVRIVGKAWLEKYYRTQIEREPFFATFRYGQKEFTLVNFHAITKRMQPETEIKHFRFFPERYPNLNLIFAGDFNCPQSHSVFNPIRKMGFESAFIGTKTTLKMACKNGCTASEFDNIFYRKLSVKVKSRGVVDFYTVFANLSDARKISDHLPIWVEFDLSDYGKP
ncbi:endonuclease/exonuclease/phosphatase family protein [Flavobacterium sp.]|uniref:endonuclease/exonuclease/phosphatase family protein n=1 Tax=Flavobacterium sp. TaxID=239 RepID=UPI001217ACA6|nr:endonuclease/exonuclease/phosphatase family protein [Flavobacterium sp.]RZJ69872.1 MAG: endonuclease [Flavobacterium sp.]